jgi:hypothetical protein
MKQIQTRLFTKLNLLIKKLRWCLYLFLLIFTMGLSGCLLVGPGNVDDCDDVGGVPSPPYCTQPCDYTDDCPSGWECGSGDYCVHVDIASCYRCPLN